MENEKEHENHHVMEFSNSFGVPFLDLLEAPKARFIMFWGLYRGLPLMDTAIYPVGVYRGPTCPTEHQVVFRWQALSTSKNTTSYILSPSRPSLGTEPEALILESHYTPNHFYTANAVKNSGWGFRFRVCRNFGFSLTLRRALR